MSVIPPEDQVQAVVSLLGVLAGLVSAAWALTLEGLENARLLVRDGTADVSRQLRAFGSRLAGVGGDADALMRAGLRHMRRHDSESAKDKALRLKDSKQASLAQRIDELRVAMTLGALEKVDGDLADRMGTRWSSVDSPSLANLRSNVEALDANSGELKAAFEATLADVDPRPITALAQNHADLRSRSPANACLFIASMALAVMSINILGLQALGPDIVPSNRFFGLSPNAMIASLELVAAALFILIVLRCASSVSEGLTAGMLRFTGVRTIEEAVESFALGRARGVSEFFLLLGVPIACTVIASVLFFKGPFLLSLLGWGPPQS